MWNGNWRAVKRGGRKEEESISMAWAWESMYTQCSTPLHAQQGLPPQLRSLIIFSMAHAECIDVKLSVIIYTLKCFVIIKFLILCNCNFSVSSSIMISNWRFLSKLPLNFHKKSWIYVALQWSCQCHGAIVALLWCYCGDVMALLWQCGVVMALLRRCLVL